MNTTSFIRNKSFIKAFLLLLFFNLTISFSGCSKETEQLQPAIPELTASINGIKGTLIENTFYIKLPITTDLKKIKPIFSGNFTDISHSGTSLSINPPKTFDFSTPTNFEVTFPDHEPVTYTVSIIFSNLPTIYISTSAPILDKENWVKNCNLIITNAGEFNGTFPASIKGRGNSTWTYYPKKPYAVKLDSKAELFGMPSHKRWCLLANWIDKTNLRNDIAFELSRRLSGLEWTPSGKFIDVVFNGTYCGNYYICEQIKVSPIRLNIDELTPDDISGGSLTGGYLLELDSYFDEEYKFKSLLELPFNLKSPDENVANEQLDYIQNYINSIEQKLINHTDFSDIESFIDTKSFADWWLLQEITQNWEPNHPKSSYIYKKRNGKLYAGPAWDFDYGTFNPNQGWYNSEAIWYKYLLSYPEFTQILKDEWNKHRSSLYAISDYIDVQYELISESSKCDEQIWPIIGSNVNGDESLTHKESVNRLKSNLINRLKWIDQHINSL